MSNRIAIVVSGLWPGGAEYSILSLSKELSSRHEVHVFCLQRLHEEIKDLPSEITIHYLDAQGMFDLRSILRLRKSLNGFTHIFAHLFWSQVWCGILAIFPRSLHQRFFWVEHNTYHERSSVSWFLLGILGRKVDLIISVSEEVRHFFNQKTRLSSQVIHNPILVHSQKTNSDIIKDNTINFVFFARLEVEKRPSLALQVWSRLQTRLKEQVNLRLYIVGTGSMLLELQNQVKEDDINEVFFLGQLKQNKAHEVMTSCHVYLSTSSQEGFPLARSEALAIGLCVATTKTGGSDYLLQQMSDIDLADLGVFFFEGEELDDWAKTLQKTIQPRYFNVELVKARQDLVSNLNLKVIAQQYDEMMSGFASSF